MKTWMIILGSCVFFAGIGLLYGFLSTSKNKVVHFIFVFLQRLLGVACGVYALSLFFKNTYPIVMFFLSAGLCIYLLFDKVREDIRAYIRKPTAETKQKGIVEIIADYGEIIEKNIKDWGGVMPESLLPCHRSQIKNAIKIMIIEESKENRYFPLGTLESGYVILADFVPDEDAKFVKNHCDKMKRMFPIKDQQAFKELYDKDDYDKWVAIMNKSAEEGRLLLNEITEFKKILIK